MYLFKYQTIKNYQLHKLLSFSIANIHFFCILRSVFQKKCAIRFASNIHCLVIKRLNSCNSCSKLILEAPLG